MKTEKVYKKRMAFCVVYLGTMRPLIKKGKKLRKDDKKLCVHNENLFRTTRASTEKPYPNKTSMVCRGRGPRPAEENGGDGRV